MQGDYCGQFLFMAVEDVEFCDRIYLQTLDCGHPNSLVTSLWYLIPLYLCCTSITDDNFLLSYSSHMYWFFCFFLSL